MRKAQAKKLPLAPDPKFNDKLVTRFVNNIMWSGKKSTSFNTFYDALAKVAKQTGEEKRWQTLHLLLRFVAVVLVVLHSRSQQKFVLTGRSH